MTVVLSFLQKGRNVKLLQKEVLVYHMSNHRLHSEKTIPLENLKPNLKKEKKIDFQPIKNVPQPPSKHEVLKETKL